MRSLFLKFTLFLNNLRIPLCATHFPYTTLFRSVLNRTFQELRVQRVALEGMILKPNMAISGKKCPKQASVQEVAEKTDRKSTRLNSSHVAISYAVFCLKKKTT